jgi:hypothetical protein
MCWGRLDGGSSTSFRGALPRAIHMSQAILPALVSVVHNSCNSLPLKAATGFDAHKTNKDVAKNCSFHLPPRLSATTAARRFNRPLMKHCKNRRLSLPSIGDNHA